MIDKEFIINNISNIEGLKNTTILKMLMEFKKQLEDSGAFHSIKIGEVVTLEAEEPAYITNVGTTTDIILNVGIPRGVGFNYSGAWVSDDNEYHPNDVVLYNGSLYICVSTILDSEVNPAVDTEHWTLFLGYGESIGNFIIGEYNISLNDPIAHLSQLVNLEQLWVNMTPNAPISDLTAYFSENLNNGDMFAVLYKGGINENQVNMMVLFSLKVSPSYGVLNVSHSDASESYVASRGLSFSYDKIYFGPCYKGAGNQSNESVIPLAIYKIKNWRV